MILPTVAVTIPRPWTWMVAGGIRRDWILAEDPSDLVGGLVALHSAAAGDADGWRRFDTWTNGTVDRKRVAEQCPHNALVGVAVVNAAERQGACWHIHFGRSLAIEPVGPLAAGDLELWRIPARRREHLRRAFLAQLRSVGGAAPEVHAS